MKKNKKIEKYEKAKFFCESCGAEVAQNARVCTNCGKFFSAVRCPHCGRVGTTEEFIHGCPECGYAVPPSQSIIGSGLVGESGKNRKNKGNKKVGQKDFFSFADIFRSKKNKAVSESKLPLWIYLVCILALVFIVIALYSCLK